MSISPMKSKTTSSTDECCPKFDPSSFTDADGNPYKIITWNEKPFVKDGTWCFCYVPLAFGRATTRALKKIKDAGAESPKDEFMILSDCKSPWYSDVFLSVAKDDVEGATVEKISGDFLAKAFEGDYSNIGTWVKEMKALLKEVLEKKAKDENTPAVDVEDTRVLFYYPTCPKCAKKYGENYVVVLAKMP